MGQKQSPIGIHGAPAWCIAAMALVAEMEKKPGTLFGRIERKFPHPCNQPLPVA
jgi:hypothetical protein